MAEIFLLILLTRGGFEVLGIRPVHEKGITTSKRVSLENFIAGEIRESLKLHFPGPEILYLLIKNPECPNKDENSSCVQKNLEEGSLSTA